MARVTPVSQAFNAAYGDPALSDQDGRVPARHRLRGGPGHSAARPNGLPFGVAADCPALGPGGRRSLRARRRDPTSTSATTGLHRTLRNRGEYIRPIELVVQRLAHAPSRNNPGACHAEASRPPNAVSGAGDQTSVVELEEAETGLRALRAGELDPAHRGCTEGPLRLLLLSLYLLIASSRARRVSTVARWRR